MKRKKLGMAGLLMATFFAVSGGPYGIEPLFSASGAGLGLLLIVLVPLLWGLPDGLTTAELTSALPVEGGYVVWVERALGPFWSFLNGWWTWLYAVVDAAVYPVMFADVTLTMVQAEAGHGSALAVLAARPSVHFAVAIAAVVVLIGINLLGARSVGETSILLSVFVTVPFLAMAAVGIWKLFHGVGAFSFPLLPDKKSLSHAFGDGLAIVIWNYLGWDTLSTIAEEVDDPPRTYPKAILLSIPLVTFFYLIASVIGLAFYRDLSNWNDGAWPMIAGAVGGPLLLGAVLVGSIASPLGQFAASVLGASRVPFVLAEKRNLPRFITAQHPKWGTPVGALVLCGVIIAILCAETFRDLVSLNVLLYAMALTLECLSLVVLRYREPNLPRPFRIPGPNFITLIVAVMPVLTAAVLVLISFDSGNWVQMALTGAAIVTGPIVYRLSRPRTGCETALP